MNQLPYSVRPATEADAAQIAQVATRGFPGYPFPSAYSPESIAAAIVAGDSRWVAQTPQGHIVGTAVLGAGVNPEVKRVVTDPDWAGNGIGTLLASALIAEALRSQATAYADCRVAGMQIAFHNAAKPNHEHIWVFPSPGQHVVYSHGLLNNIGLRETMVNMSVAQMPLTTYRQLFFSLPDWAIQQLKYQIAWAENPTSEPKVSQLTSAAEVMHRVNRGLAELVSEPISPSSEVSLTHLGLAHVAVIAPDASTYILNPTQLTQADIRKTIQLLTSIGIQIIFAPINSRNRSCLTNFHHSNFSAHIFRPWQRADGLITQVVMAHYGPEYTAHLAAPHIAQAILALAHHNLAL